MPRSRYSRYTADYRVMLQLLRQVRLEADLTQAELAKRMKTEQTVISKMERGVFRVDLLDLLSYLSAAKADPVEFLRTFMAQTNRGAR